MRESGVRYFLCILWINIILTPSPFGMRAITKPPVQRKTEQTVMLYDVIMHL